MLEADDRFDVAGRDRLSQSSGRHRRYQFVGNWIRGGLGPSEVDQVAEKFLFPITAPNGVRL